MSLKPVNKRQWLKKQAFSYEETACDTPILRTSNRQSQLRLFDGPAQGSPKHERLPNLDFTPTQSVVNSHLKESILSADFDNQMYPNSILFIKNKRGRQDLARTRKLQNQLHFQTFDETNQKNKHLQTLAGTGYAFSPCFDKGIFSPTNMTHAGGSTCELPKNPNRPPPLKKIEEVQRSVQGHLKRDPNWNSLLINSDIIQRGKVSQKSSKVTQGDPTQSPVVVVIEPHSHKKESKQQKSRNCELTQNKTSGFDFSQHSLKTSDIPESMPQRVKHLLFRLQDQYQDYQVRHSGGLMERVFKARVLEERAFPSIKRFNAQFTSLQR